MAPELVRGSIGEVRVIASALAVNLEQGGCIVGTDAAVSEEGGDHVYGVALEFVSVGRKRLREKVHQ